MTERQKQTFEEFSAKVEEQNWPKIKNIIGEIEYQAEQKSGLVTRGYDKYQWAAGMLRLAREADVFPEYLTDMEVAYVCENIRSPNGFMSGPLAHDPCSRIIEATTQVYFSSLEALVDFNFSGYYVYAITKLLLNNGPNKVTLYKVRMAEAKA